MKISKREKRMLYTLALIVCAFLYYQFGYITLNNLVARESKENESEKKKYEAAVTTIKSMEEQEAKVKILNAKIKDQTSPFYPVISQEHIILEIDKLIKESGLEGGMAFKEVEVKSVSPEKKSDKDTDLPQSSIQSVADEYRDKYESRDQSKDNKSGKDTSSMKENKNSNASSDVSTTKSSNDGKIAQSDNSNSENDKKENSIYQMQLNVEFNGTYAQVVKFLELLKNYNKKMPAYSISMSTKNLNDVKGSVNMMVYAIPKIDNELEEYLIWNLKNTYGKDKPFTVNSEAGTGIKADVSKGDFLIAAHSSFSDLPTVIIGRANDSLRSTYAYGDSKGETETELVLTKSGDKYFYKYKTNNGSIPKDYSGNGSEFVPSGENIEINIQSESRVNSDDKAALKLNLINNTDKLVNINISGDDRSDPRISIDGNSKNINVNKK